MLLHCELQVQEFSATILKPRVIHNPSIPQFEYLLYMILAWFSTYNVGMDELIYR